MADNKEGECCLKTTSYGQNNESSRMITRQKRKKDAAEDKNSDVLVSNDFSKPIYKEGEGQISQSCDSSNLHYNNNLIEAINNDFKLHISQLKSVIEQNRAAIANIETICIRQSSKNDTVHLELHTLRKEYDIICSENTSLKKENTEYRDSWTDQ